jgi:hypothetical protein
VVVTVAEVAAMTTKSIFLLAIMAVMIAGVAATAPTTTMLTVHKVYVNCGFFGCADGYHKNFDPCSCDPD